MARYRRLNLMEREELSRMLAAGSSHAHPTVIDPWPVDVPPNWSDWVDAPQFDHELIQLRTCITRQAPFGTPAWQKQTAMVLGLDATLRPPGRPRKTPRENGA